MNKSLLRAICSVSLLALIALCLAWELWLAPQRPGGSWLAIKVVPLLPAVAGILRGKLYTYRAMTLLIIAYLVEGTVRAYSDKGFSAQLALIEIALTLIIFVSAIAFVRATAGTSKNIQ